MAAHTWKQVLTRGPDAGAVDLAMDPSNPRVLYAGFWQVSRKPWHFDSGGPGSGLWKSTDGGDTLDRYFARSRPAARRLKAASASPFRRPIPSASGPSWKPPTAACSAPTTAAAPGPNSTTENDLRQRAWYYSHIFADPKNPDTVYALQRGHVQLHRRRPHLLTPMRPPHGDNHDLWIAPDDPQRMIESNDGGANITNDGGHTWSSDDNQPTAQFYRVALDERFSLSRLRRAAGQHHRAHRQPHSRRRHHRQQNWYDVGGGESGWIAPDPRNSQIVYAGSYGNLITRQDHRTGQMRNINAWPDNPMGYGVERHEVPLPVELPHRLFAARSEDALHRLATCCMKTDQRRPELGDRSAPI